MEFLAWNVHPWQVVLLLLVPSLFWLGRGLWLWRRESVRRRSLARMRARDSYYSAERWRNDE